MQFQEKTNGQTFQSFQKSSFKKRIDKLLKKKANAVRRKTNGQTLQPATQSLKEKQTDKHFEKQTNVVLGKNTWTNISKKKNSVLINRASYIKTNGQTLKKEKQMQFGEK